MDRAGVKRPRSGTPESSNKKKDKNKKKKKSKLNPKNKSADSNNDDNHNNANPLESTATADGQYMAKILSTFSKMEQSRFEAFKRVSFPCNAISQYVAHCLAERQQQQRDPAHYSQHVFSSSGNGSAPQLQDLVVPGQEEEITTVVTTLAKAYAQRLCAAAKAQAQAQQSSSSSSSATAFASSRNNNNDTTAIQPEHVLQAFYVRKQQGQDPGFFLQPNEGITIASTNDGKEQMKRVAALAAEEDFDRSMEDYKEYLQKKEAAATATASGGGGGTAPMDDDDSDSGDEAEVELDMEKELEEEMANA